LILIFSALWAYSYSKVASLTFSHRHRQTGPWTYQTTNTWFYSGSGGIQFGNTVETVEIAHFKGADLRQVTDMIRQGEFKEEWITRRVTGTPQGYPTGFRLVSARPFTFKHFGVIFEPLDTGVHFGNRLTGWGLVLPYCLIVLALATTWLPWLLRALRRRRRVRTGRCVQCGYDLRESPGRCPECGAAYANKTFVFLGLTPPP
jgi:hypothetical protein